ncbi:FKBP-type peptidyl-prolyl cis-trans isomerase [Duganella sp. CF517]|uniref:FKBP-type peptidyl-prolyl cis-trans isomerase n=1 Tax=Duganella sp. CF517 TaxID=1881038 RepID=UPI0008BCDAB4|nr:FKBP-type peptidyl-prolyl cis-trans isomerase [Duganella sp. CF517]SEO28043.1 FKBP-type peptidyl-prolyl cis-trans isomerase [Duganella sp. CF517]
MKSKFHIIVAVACLAILTACGGGSKKSDPVVVPQPAYAIKDVTVGGGTGSATLAEKGDLVAVAYTGYLYDSTKPDGIGAKVESSIDSGTTAPPFTLGVGGIVPNGWDLAVVGMRVGGVRLATLPDNLAYGAAERKAQTVLGVAYAAIPANSPLVYELRLVSVVKPNQLPNQPGGTTLVITELQAGTGAAATAGKTAVVRYTGWLYDRTAVDGKGKQFDTNIRTPAVDALSIVIDSSPLKVIPGFNLGVKDMKVGGKRTVYIPATLAYGSASPSTTIPANSNLIFDIELISVN